MLSSELIQQIKHIQLKAGYLATDALAGEYLSAFKGTGIEFEKVREYIPGDEIRTIDWNVTARMNAPFVKVFHEERELTVMLAIDVSGSQRFGTQGKFKHELAAELAAILAFLAIKNNDKVGLLVYSDHVEALIPPNKGKAHIWQIIRTVLTHQPQGNGTSLDAACQYLSRVLKRKSMCFIISDFIQVGTPQSLKVLAKRHDVTCVQTLDQREQTLADFGYIQFLDAETGEKILIDGNDQRFRQQWSQLVSKEQSDLELNWRKQGIHSFQIQTHQSAVGPLVKYIRKREKKA